MQLLQVQEIIFAKMKQKNMNIIIKFSWRKGAIVWRYLFRVAATQHTTNHSNYFLPRAKGMEVLQYLHSNCSCENHARMRQLTRRELALAPRRWWIVTGSSARLFYSMVVARKPRSSCKQTKLRARINWNSVEMCARTYEHSFRHSGIFIPRVETLNSESCRHFVIDQSG